MLTQQLLQQHPRGRSITPLDAKSITCLLCCPCPRVSLLTQGYIAADELLSNPRSPSLRTDLPKPLINRSPKTYDMEAHYRFGGTVPALPAHAWPPLYKEVLSFIGKEGTPGVMPSAPKLQAAGRGDLVTAIGRVGAWNKVATELGLQMAQSLREVYFTCPSSLRSGQEIEFKLPGMPQRFAATVSSGSARSLMHPFP
eukprot:COSAG05_NODE_2332_length_3219_cov_8.397436_2_plen_198_part_00